MCFVTTLNKCAIRFWKWTKLEIQTFITHLSYNLYMKIILTKINCIASKEVYVLVLIWCCFKTYSHRIRFLGFRFPISFWAVSFVFGNFSLFFGYWQRCGVGFAIPFFSQTVRTSTIKDKSHTIDARHYVACQLVVWSTRCLVIW